MKCRQWRVLTRLTFDEILALVEINYVAANGDRPLPHYVVRRLRQIEAKVEA